MNNSDHIPSSPQAKAPSSVLQRLTKETLARGHGVILQIVDAAMRLLTTRPRSLSAEVRRYWRTMKKKGWSPSALEELNILKGLVRIVGRSAPVIDVRPHHIVRLLESRHIDDKTATLYRNDIAGFFLWWSQDLGVRFSPAVWVNMTQLKLKVTPPPAKPAGRKGTKRYECHQRNAERRLSNREIRRLLFVTLRYRPDAMPILLVSLFLGLRPEAEAIPLWQDLDRDACTWKIRAATVKNRVVRTVPIPAFLMIWLDLFRQENGPIVTFGYSTWSANIRPNLFARAGVPYHDDCLRVTAISNWVVYYTDKDIKWVAERLGNSAYVIKANYMDPPTLVEATAFMTMLPPAGWIPRAGYRAGRGSWSAIAASKVMASVPTLRQYVDFLRGKSASTPVIASAAIPNLRQAA